MSRVNRLKESCTKLTIDIDNEKLGSNNLKKKYQMCNCAFYASYHLTIWNKEFLLSQHIDLKKEWFHPCSGV